MSYAFEASLTSFSAAVSLETLPRTVAARVDFVALAADPHSRPLSKVQRFPRFRASPPRKRAGRFPSTPRSLRRTSAPRAAPAATPAPPPLLADAPQTPVRQIRVLAHQVEVKLHPLCHNHPFRRDLPHSVQPTWPPRLTNPEKVELDNASLFSYSYRLSIK